jgi:hypothetical protein
VKNYLSRGFSKKEAIIRCKGGIQKALRAKKGR